MKTFAVYAVLTIALFTGISSADAQKGAQSSTQDIGWPRQLTKEGNTIVYYQPQVIDWKDYKNLEANIAFGITPKGGKETMGVATMKGETSTDHTSRTVYIRNIEYNSVRFPSLSESEKPAMEKLFREMMPTEGDEISLDRLMADVDQSNTTAKTVAVKTDPPQIFFSQSPSVLLVVDGKPVVSSIQNNSMEFVVNTNWDLFFDKANSKYYMLVGHVWLTASDLKGPWEGTTSLPADMSKLPSGQNFDEVKKNIPARSGSAPYVFYSDNPAELILVKGAPVYTKIPSTDLSYVANSDNDLFVDNRQKLYYVLLSGRWFKSSSLDGGSWSYAGDNLPADFKEIPESSAKAHVLSSIPGTVEASDAVMLAQIPTTAVINKAQAEKQVKLTYNGTPKFAPIESTSLEYATNTQQKVIKDGNVYYLCYQGVWFISSSATGPWKVADKVDPQIYNIPPSSPVYNVTYVTQTNATPTTVESSTTAGYFGMFLLGAVTGAAIVYGTGWYYPPYVYWGPAYPIYTPWPATYGAGVVYNPATGGFAGGRVAYGPYGSAGSAAWYNPATGRYGRSASVQGWYGGRSSATTYNPWTGGVAHTNQGHNAYAQWGHSTAAVNNQWVQTGHINTRNGSIAGYRTSGGKSGVIRTGPQGNKVVHTNNGVYAGHDGNVYRRDGKGSWSKYENGNWQPQQRHAQNQNTMHNLDRADMARQRGHFQTQHFENAHRFQNNQRFQHMHSMPMRHIGGFRRR